MLEFYPQIKQAHIGLALASGTLFALRGAGSLGGLSLPHHGAVRGASYAIDTALLTAALMLVSILPAALFANGWLWAKLAVLVAYIGLGVVALGSTRRWAVRAGCYVAALLAFGMMYGIARTHDPLGLLRRWPGG